MLENFIYFKKRVMFLDQLLEGNILDEAIVFIEDTRQIWNHGTYFDGSTFDPSNIEASIQDILNTKVDKLPGKGLSTNDYTTTEKNKLAGIASGAEVNVQSDWNVTNSSSDAYIKNKPSLAEVATSGSYNSLTNKPTIDTALSTTSTNAVQNKAIAAGINAKYTKPSTGIPKTDLASAVQTSLGKADTALQSIPSEYITETELAAKGYTTNIGTITGIKMNGASKGTSGVVDLGTVITSHQDISGKLDKTTAASTYLTKTDAATTYLGISAKAANATKADSATKATQDASGNVITSTYAKKTDIVDEVAVSNGTEPSNADIWIDTSDELEGTLGMSDAPANNKLYGRKNNTWVEVPVDMSSYATKDELYEVNTQLQQDLSDCATKTELNSAKAQLQSSMSSFATKSELSAVNSKIQVVTEEQYTALGTAVNTNGIIYLIIE